MVEKLAPNEISFAIHGPNVESDVVSGEIFAVKLQMLISALKAADTALYGKAIHEYTVSRLHNSAPTVVLAERLKTQRPTFFPGEISAIDGFYSCAEAITLGDSERVGRFGNCAARIKRLSHGANGKYFGYAEVWFEQNRSIRVDNFLNSRAYVMTSHVEQEIAKASKAQAWFAGSSQGTFDGKLKVADLRGRLPEITLFLSAGSSPIGCVCRVEHVPKIREALDQRVRLSGRAIYSKGNPLPVRIEVDDIKIVGSAGDFRKWAGSFEPFDKADWEDSV